MSIDDVSPSKLSSLPEYDNHSRVVRFSDASTGLRGFIAIHRSRGVLSTGGTRFFNYRNEEDALRDVLRLSKAMSSKCVVAGLPYGGAKAVIMGDPKVKTQALLSAYADVVISLNGTFRTGEDVGMTEDDVQFLLTRSDYFNGKRGVAGDPSPYAAMSTYVVMKSVLGALDTQDDLAGKHVAIRGVGKVGGALADILAAQSATLSVSDIDTRALNRVSERIADASIVSNDEIPFLPVNVYAPCAMGNEVTKENVTRFKAGIICGGANNQLADPSLSDDLRRRGVIFVPDYLANAGGLINVSDELESDGYHGERVNSRIALLGKLAHQLALNSKKNDTTILFEAEQYVNERIGV